MSGKQRLVVGTIVNIAALVAWGAEALDRRCYSSQCAGDGGTSRAGFRSKKPTGESRKPVDSTGMTGQSSGRGMWVRPNVCQTTTSVSATGRSAAVHRGSPSPPPCWFG